MTIQDFLNQDGQLDGRGHTLPEDFFSNISDEKHDALLEELFQHYRKVGYPYQPTGDKWRKNQWKTLMGTEPQQFQPDNSIKQTMVGLPLAWSFHAHSANVRVGEKKSCMEAFTDDAHLKRIIKNRMRMGTYFNNAGMRKQLKINTGVQGVSNFRPTAASSVYLRFLDNPAKSMVWDPCGGYSGRLLGACLAGVGRYIATDPCKNTFQGLKKTQEFVMCQPDCKTRAKIIRKCAEDPKLRMWKDSFDLVFTSPPYFNTEKYSDEPDQSWVKYDTKEKWKKGFLKGMIQNAFINLKKGCPFALNIANVRSYPDLVEDAKSLAIDIGFEYHGELKYSLSTMPSNKKKFKYETILVFTKPE